MMMICLAEDRRSFEPALRLLVASLDLHCKELPVQLFSPDPSDSFKKWLHGYPSVTLNRHRFEGQKYDVKPQALLHLLDRGFREIVWIDSDVLVNSDFRSLFEKLPPEVFSVAEEALCSAHSDADGLRARLWGFAVARTLPFTVNSAIIRATDAHRGILVRWMELLASPEYKAAQQKSWNERPPHLLGDQDVLTALLASIDDKVLPLKFVRRGHDIIQYFGSSGYTVGERLRHLFTRMPPFVHSQGYRPWLAQADQTPSGIAAKFNSLYREVTPYAYLARRYRSMLETSEWIEPRTQLGKMLDFLSFGQAPLFGMPLALIAGTVRLFKPLR
jgi:hypothetical protein